MYPLAIRMLRTAIERARRRLSSWARHLGTDFDFDIDIYPGAGAFVCGESTALMIFHRGEARGSANQAAPSTESASGGSLLSQQRRDLCQRPAILLNGGGWFRSIGYGKTARAQRSFRSRGPSRT
jgi:NADH:ubiquinone oxidoreductase subunit F (NADH-binding)